MEKGRYERWPVERVVVNSNVRKTFDEEGLRRHAESLTRDGQLRPLLVRADGTLIAGERTLRAAKLAELTYVDVKILDREAGAAEMKRLQLVENLMREELSDAEVYLACTELMALNPQWLKKDLMQELHFDASMATRIFSVDELIPAAKDAFLKGMFGFSKAYAIAKGASEDQEKKLAQILAGVPRDEVERKRCRGDTGSNAVKLARVKIALDDGASVVISGKAVTMQGVVELLTETLREARKAASRYDVKTFVAMMRDKAKVDNTRPTTVREEVGHDDAKQ